MSHDDTAVAGRKLELRGGLLEIAASAVAVIPACQFDKRRNCDAPEMSRKKATVDFSV